MNYLLWNENIKEAYMEEFKLSELLNGRPENINNENEKKCYDILEELNIEYQRVEYNYFPKNIEELKLIDERLQVKGIKNLIFKNKDRSQFYFIIIPFVNTIQIRFYTFDAKFKKIIAMYRKL